MKIQSLSIDVPAGCLNKCHFCVAHMHRNEYENQIENNHRFRRLYSEDYKKRLLFARDNGCNTVMLTGNGEPLLNRKFLENFSEWNQNLPTPFRWVEIQTSGTLLDDEYLRFLRDCVQVNTISLSLSNVFCSEKNAVYNRTDPRHIVDIDHLCSEIKRYDFNLRLSLNMTDYYNDETAESIFKRALQLKANQVTFRVLYESGQGTEEDKWAQEHRCDNKVIDNITEYILKHGRALEILPFGAVKYSVHEMSVVLDKDCMNTKTSDVMKYLILRPDCKLYSRWDDKGSLVF